VVADPSEVAPDAAAGVDDPEEAVDPPAGAAASALSDAAVSDAVAVLLEALADRASFFAQPLPLKWIAGAVRALRIPPPHDSHAPGPCPWTPCMTSTRRPQAVQTYS
jgi:hypothetical protein